MVVEVHVQPFTPRGARANDGLRYELRSDPCSAGPLGDHGVQNERVGVAVPGDVDESNEVGTLSGAHPA